MTPHVRLSFGWLVGRPVVHNFLLDHLFAKWWYIVIKPGGNVKICFSSENSSQRAFELNFKLQIKVKSQNRKFF